MSNSTGLVFSFSTSVTYSAPTGDALLFSWVISRDIQPDGIDSSAFGDVTTRYSRNVYQIGEDSVAFSEPRVAHLQYVYALDGGDFSAFEEPRVTWVKYAYPDGVVTEDWGSPQINMSVVAQGISDAVITNPLLYNKRQYTYPNSFVGTVVPDPIVSKHSIEPFGIPSTSVVSTPNVYTLRQLVRTYQTTSDSVVESPYVYNRNQYAYQLPTTDTSIFGTANASLELRSFYFTGDDSSSFGTSDVALKKRYLAGVGFNVVQEVFGVTLVENRTNDILPEGIPSASFGGALVYSNTQYIYSRGHKSSYVEIAEVDPNPRRITYKRYDSLDMGTPELRLVDTYIRNVRLFIWDYDAQAFGNSRVYNRNRTLFVEGRDSADLLRSYHYTYNNAALIKLKDSGVDSYGEGVPDVGHRLKTITVAPYEPDPQRIIGFARLYNKRKIINLIGEGFLPTRFGIPLRVWSNAQYVKPYTEYNHSSYGVCWASHSPTYIRTLNFDRPQRGYPYVSHSPSYINPEGVNSGWISPYLGVSTHRNIIGARQTESKAEVGYPALSNLTPEVRVRGVTYTELGSPYVRSSRAYVYAQGAASTSIGAHRVEYKTRHIRPGGLSYTFVGFPGVDFDRTQQPPVTQFIRNVVVQMGAGVVVSAGWPDPNAPWSGEIIPFGYPDVHTNVLYVTGIYDGHFGSGAVKTNVIEVPPGPETVAWGTALLLGGTKRMRPQSMGDTLSFGLTDVRGPQYIRLGERLIGDVWEPYSYHTTDGGEHPPYVFQPQTVGPVVGSHSEVQHYHRVMYVRNNEYLGDNGGAVHHMGNAVLSHRPQHVYPTGIYTYKRGIPEVVRMLDKKFYPYDFDSSVFGATDVVLQDYGPKTIFVPGKYPNTPQFSVSEVQNRHRPLGVKSWDSFTSPKGAQYVGFYTWVYMQGQDSSLIGTPWVANNPQEIHPEFVVDDAPFWVSARMRLHHTNITPYFLVASSKVGRPSLTN